MKTSPPTIGDIYVHQTCMISLEFIFVRMSMQKLVIMRDFGVLGFIRTMLKSLEIV